MQKQSVIFGLILACSATVAGGGLNADLKTKVTHCHVTTPGSCITLKRLTSISCRPMSTDTAPIGSVYFRELSGLCHAISLG